MHAYRHWFTLGKIADMQSDHGYLPPFMIIINHFLPCQMRPGERLDQDGLKP